MKILHIPHAYAPVMGGAEIICQRVSEELARRGHQVSVVTADVGAVQGYYDFGIPPVGPRNETINGVSVERIPFSGLLYRVGGKLRMASRSGSVARKAAERLMRLLRWRFGRQIAGTIHRIAPDVVMTMPHLVVNVLAVLEAKKTLGFPLVMVPMLHEHDPHWDVDGVAAALKQADAVVAMTNFEIQRLVESYDVPREKIFLGSVGIDAVPVTGDRQRGPRVVFLGRKAGSKGLDCLIDAMTLVWRDIPEAELYLAGVRVPETQIMDDKIAALPDHLRSKVHDLGVVEGEEKADLLRSARCLVLPSKTESFGMVILDAWVHATPVVVWDLPLFRSIVDQGIDGLLAEPIGAGGLANAITRLLRNPSFAQRLGEAGRNKARDKYHWGAVATGYIAAYEFAYASCTTQVQN